MFSSEDPDHYFLPEGVINVADIVRNSTIYGPDHRFVIWVQGCSIRCKGCWNKSMWEFIPVMLMDIEVLIAMIKDEDGIRGVTILGGEPLDQSEALLILGRQIKTMGLDLMVYTGYELGDVQDPEARALLEISDIVVSGPYDETKRDVSHRWKGSANQTIIFQNCRAGTSMPDEESSEAELHVSADGTMRLLGYPDEELRRVFNGC
jgi:anaerobic ribonucleoside-triphosphate reductase activating protein